jgi:hypothetical protein
MQNSHPCHPERSEGSRDLTFRAPESFARSLAFARDNHEKVGAYSRIWIFIALCFICAIGLSAYYYATRSSKVSQSQALLSSGARDSVSGQARQIFFRYTGVDDHYGKVAFVDYPGLGVPHFIDRLSCNVVYFAHGQGICLYTEPPLYSTFAAELFDAKFQKRFHIPLQGGPSRTRISPDGKLAALTVFVTGHGYASVDFVTQTLLIDIASGKTIADLESFRITRDGQIFQAKDFNFWGVTFTSDSNHFYCTLSSNKKHYLVLCDAAARTGMVLHENVECPSVSPDGKHVAYKKRFNVDGRVLWQLHVLDPSNMQETPLAEKRSVDDQLEWLDNERVLYSVSDNPGGSSATTNVWRVDIGGRNPPELFLAKAYSPAVVR